MQAASAVQVTVRHFGVWNLMLCLAGAIALSVDAAWLWSSLDESPRGGGALLIALACGGVAAVLTLWRRRPLTLRWDAQRWHFTCCRWGARPVELIELRVVLDLGGWMLLKGRADGCARCDWIPLQWRGLGPQWQPLRCALYAHGGRWVRPEAGHEGMRGGSRA